MRFQQSSWVILGAALGAGCSSSPSSGTPQKDGGGGSVHDAGGGGSGGKGGSGTGGAAFTPAAHPPMPQAVTLKGPVMASPRVVGISFQGDALQPSLDTFVSQMVATTSYWSGATAEYGVGPLTATPPQHLAEAAPAMLTDGDVQAWLTSKITAGGGFPQPDANTIYVLFYPDGTDVTMGGGSLCQDYQGYHSDYLISPGTYVTYAVVGRCPPPVAGLAEIDEISAEASHEMIEAATDPIPQEKPAWLQVDADHLGWALVGGGAELGDLCAPFPDAFYKPMGITSLVQRTWSNKAAAASHDPCEPDGASPYFNAAPVLTDTIHGSSPSFGAFTTKGVTIPLGSTKTIELDLYSDAPTSGPWKVSVLDLTSVFFGGAPALKLSLDKSQGVNGDKLHLTIKALAKSNLGAAPFWVQNDLGGVTTVWIGLVGN